MEILAPQKYYLWGRLDGHLVKCLTLDFGSGYDLTVRGIEPCVRLCTDNMEPAWDSLSPSLSQPLSLSKINK